MNKVLPFVVLIGLTTASCTTLANRRDLYWPKKAEGEYTQKLKQLRIREGRNIEAGRPQQRTGRQPFRSK